MLSIDNISNSFYQEEETRPAAAVWCGVQHAFGRTEHSQLPGGQQAMFPTKNTFKAEKRLLARGNWGRGGGVIRGEKLGTVQPINIIRKTFHP